MSKYRHKKPAKYVGWIDLIRTLISMVLLVPSVVLLSKIFGNNAYAEVIVIFGTVHFVIQAFAAVALIDATAGDRDPPRTLWLIRIWWWSTIAFLVVDCLTIYIFTELPLLTFEVVPIIFLWIVKVFVDELDGCNSGAKVTVEPPEDVEEERIVAYNSGRRNALNAKN